MPHLDMVITSDRFHAAKDLGIWGVAAFIGSAAGPAILGPTLHIFGLLSLGRDFSSTLSGGAVPDENGVVYGVLGYQAIMVLGCVFVSGCILLLVKIKKR